MGTDGHGPRARYQDKQRKHSHPISPSKRSLCLQGLYLGRTSVPLWGFILRPEELQSSLFQQPEISLGIDHLYELAGIDSLSQGPPHH